jgi:hypothetical protein
MTREHSCFARVVLHGKRIGLVLVFMFGALGPLCPTRFDAARADKLPDVSGDSSDSETDIPDDFDLERCQRYCVGGPGGSNVMSGQVGSCIQDCNEKYWKSYDKRMKLSK